MVLKKVVDILKLELVAVGMTKGRRRRPKPTDPRDRSVRLRSFFFLDNRKFHVTDAVIIAFLLFGFAGDFFGFLTRFPIVSV